MLILKKLNDNLLTPYDVSRENSLNKYNEEFS